jgi:hypothetical protein
MSKDPRNPTWVTVGAGVTTRDGSAPEAPEPPAPPAVNPVQPQWSAPRWQLVVGPLSDAAKLESADKGSEPFEWTELEGVEWTDLVVLRCIDDGVDPTATLEPVEERQNPFTGETSRLTQYDRYFDSLEMMAGGKLLSAKEVGDMVADGCQFEAIVVRLPPAFVARLASLDGAAMSDLAARWAQANSQGPKSLSEENARRGVHVLVASAKRAVGAGLDVFLWTPE